VVAETDHRSDQCGGSARSDDDEHRAPSKQIGDAARQTESQEVSSDGRGKVTPKHDLALVNRHIVGDDCQRERKDAAGCHSGHHATEQQNRKVRGARANERRRHRDE
jgi:hypothetical protein